MVLVCRMYDHFNPVVVERFPDVNEQSIKDAQVVAEVYNRRDGNDYKVFIEYPKNQEVCTGQTPA